MKNQDIRLMKTINQINDINEINEINYTALSINSKS
jgi:hypothetical protein